MGETITNTFKESGMDDTGKGESGKEAESGANTWMASRMWRHKWQSYAKLPGKKPVLTKSCNFATKKERFHSKSLPMSLLAMKKWALEIWGSKRRWCVGIINKRTEKRGVLFLSWTTKYTWEQIEEKTSDDPQYCNRSNTSFSNNIETFYCFQLCHAWA